MEIIRNIEYKRNETVVSVRYSLVSEQMPINKDLEKASLSDAFENLNDWFVYRYPNYKRVLYQNKSESLLEKERVWVINDDDSEDIIDEFDDDFTSLCETLMVKIIEVFQNQMLESEE